MATKVQQINPLDLRTSLGIGVNLPFSGKAVFNTTYTSREAIKANLINYFLTNKGERFFNPLFGSDLRSLLFENISEESTLRIKTKIEREMANFFPNVVIKIFEINNFPDRNSVNIFLRYEIMNSNIEDDILINIEQ